MATDAAAAGATGRLVCLTGPESSGKSALAAALAARLDVPLVPEVARDYLEGRRDYVAEDVLEIARRQLAAEAAALVAAPGLVIADTDLLVIRIWWEERFGELPEEIVQGLAARSERVYLLAEPDLPWEPDPLRENPTDRQRLFLRHRQLLDEGPFPFGLVSGFGEERLSAALAQLRAFYPELAED
jgi:nicotinamide riboside kinase